jgi:hypothetical protein
MWTVSAFLVADPACPSTAVGEAGSGADEGDEVGRVHRTPPVLGGLDELEHDRQAGRARA